MCGSVLKEDWPFVGRGRHRLQRSKQIRRIVHADAKIYKRLRSSKSTSCTPGSVARRRSGSCAGAEGAGRGTIRFLPGRRPFGVFRGRPRVVSAPVHEVFAVAETGERESFVQHLRRHEQRETSYLEMSRGLAQSGIEKWTVDTSGMTMTFCDKSGREMLVEQIE
jgi:Protein of unknown function (DUF1398)